MDQIDNERTDMAKDSDQQLRELLKVEHPDQAGTDRVAKTMAQVRAGVGARDALIFAIVRIWTVIARLLAPVFAMLAVRKAKFDAGRRPADDHQSDSK